MRYALDRKAQTHQRIVKEASVRFRRDGIGATGLQPLMKSLGLTHGGFYAHFKSKDDLVEQALRLAVDDAKAFTRETFTGPDSLSEFIDVYLSRPHRDEPGSGCPLPNMCAELGQLNQPSPLTDEIIVHLLDTFDEALQIDNPEPKSMLVLSSLVGALMLSRSVHDKQLSEHILNVTREHVKLHISKQETVDVSVQPSAPEERPLTT
ncbi:TetR/AcrR family transcriptional regulator [Pseudomonas viridiflava]|uniref:TetR/AcrR family transcriptional regulator n=1 Tax=Pseudomonas viridiflava TaxID=33069 RepID=UPI001FD683E0|nr:TetR/AcrR family transcriptional regulator [Pseudomonas viridiflava]MCJ8176984.1 TetR/AcrR family transcriptional regulator [Pseudomonas viridiflava]MEE3925243.1 TetR/AcrR family transcriptional regulator [Pseudomonas viridiflava]MEE3931526.1 TetR/AcrR family transcriptional regulator [Pseudomonas viridiflava]MEE3942335.1 TetR/AcrR family transcriptional regulator [Pseudomonas viridiflava]MEE3968201.1 TetR/AcrR family transcriptional regulator [Pseudomonas viridiflava]